MPRFDPQLDPEMARLLQVHRAQPEITFAQNLASLEEDVTREALGKTRVYLDLRYWIFLRDAEFGIPQKPVHSKLLEVMIKGVSEGRLVCPITEAVFFELDRQGDTERRMQTVRMIDKLSNGVVIKNSLDRVACEIHDFFDALILKKELPVMPCRTVWVRPCSFLGTQRLTGWGKTEDLAINKAFMSYMWTQSIEDLLRDTPVPSDDLNDRSRATAEQITESSAKRSSEMKNFEQVFEDEVAGMIEGYRSEIGEAFRPHAAEMLRNIDGTGHDYKEYVQHALNLAFSAATAPKPHFALPLIRIIAGLHAFIRWQRNRPFRFNDIFDLRHATAAIPYCDIFLTEKFVKTACTSTHLDFGTRYESRIINDEVEAIDAVSRL